MVENKHAEGLKFMFRLDQASADKDKLLELAHTTLCESHSKRTFTDRCGKDLNLLSLDLGETQARIHILANKEVSTKDKLCMIIKRYVVLSQKDNPRISEKRAIDNFCSELQKRYPKEYGVEPKDKAAVKQPFNLMMKSAQTHSIV